MIDLDEIAKDCHVQYSDRIEIHNSSINEFIINIVLAHFAKRYKDNIILYGGQTASPLFFGFKNMRTLSTDLDFVVKERALSKIIKDENLFYNSKLQVFYCYFKEVLCVFTSGKIHDWIIPKDFYNSITQFTVHDKIISLCSREFTLALKLRRGYYNNCVMFGKDSIDIINLLGAPIFKRELKPINFDKASELALSYAGYKSPDMLNDAKKQLIHIKPEERKIIEDQIDKFKNNILKLIQ